MSDSDFGVRRKYNYRDTDVPPILPMQSGKSLLFEGSLVDSPIIGCEVLPEFGYLLNKFGSFGLYSSVDEDKTLMIPFCSQKSNMVDVKNLAKVLVDESRASIDSGFRVTQKFEPEVNLKAARRQKRIGASVDDSEKVLIFLLYV